MARICRFRFSPRQSSAARRRARRGTSLAGNAQDQAERPARVSEGHAELPALGSVWSRGDSNSARSDPERSHEGPRYRHVTCTTRTCSRSMRPVQKQPAEAYAAEGEVAERSVALSRPEGFAQGVASTCCPTRRADAAADSFRDRTGDRDRKTTAETRTQVHRRSRILRLTEPLSLAPR